MNGIKRKHKGFCLSQDTITEIKLKSIQEEINDSRALDLIVEEWVETKETQKYGDDSESLCLDYLVEKIESLEALIDKLILKLQRTRL